MADVRTVSGLLLTAAVYQEFSFSCRVHRKTQRLDRQAQVERELRAADKIWQDQGQPKDATPTVFADAEGNPYTHTEEDGDMHRQKSQDNIDSPHNASAEHSSAVISEQQIASTSLPPSIDAASSTPNASSAITFELYVPPNDADMDSQGEPPMSQVIRPQLLNFPAC